jgi:hypothetical protein
MADEVKVPAEAWNPKAQLEGLMFEAQLDAGDAAAATARILREHALLAAQSICHLAAYAQTERVRLEAARYVVDATLKTGLDQDIRLQQSQTKLVGQALYAAVRALGLRYGFDPDASDVRELAHDTILTLAVQHLEGEGTATTD